MTIDKLSQTSLKICLDNNDFKKYHLKSSDINIRNIKLILIELSGTISKLLDINAADSKLFVEVFSYKTSCVIFLSNMVEITEKGKDIICQFENYENLQLFCRTLNALYKDSVNTSKLYSGTDNIRLILKLNSDYENICHFAEGYCHIFALDTINSGVTEEYYTKIVSENAVKKILELKS